MVGVDDQQGTTNTDKITDHFVVIVGMGIDSIGNYFLFDDNAVGANNIGTSDKNRLYCLCSASKLVGDIDPDNGYAHHAGRYGKYTVTQIRESK